MKINNAYNHYKKYLNALIQLFRYLKQNKVNQVCIIYKSLNKKQCSTCKEGCVKPLDYEFVCPDYLLNPVQTETVNKLINKFNIPIDERIDLNSHQKTEQK